MNRGRKTSYQPEYAEQAYKLCLLGAIDKDLASFFNVCNDTIENWKKKHPEFLESLKRGKEETDNKVVRSLFERATGYTCKEAKTFSHRGMIVTKEVDKHYPPDPVSMIFWLKNRKPKEWRDKQSHEIEFSEGEYRKKLQEMTSEEVLEEIKRLKGQ